MTARAADFNRTHYERVAAGHDDYWRLMAAPRFRVSTILEILRVEPVSSVADLGCGNGQLLLDIRRHFPMVRLAGFDIAASQLEANRLRNPEIEWITCDLSNPKPLPEGNFDAVIASEIIEHFDEPIRLLHHARELVKPGGRCILSTQSGPVHETERRVGHVRHFSAGDMAALLSSAGLNAERVWNAGFPFHDLSKWAANRNPDGMMEAFGDVKYGPAQKGVCFALRALFLFNSRTRGNQLFAVARRAG
jgi:SAM-dependent methyltransferase